MSRCNVGIAGKLSAAVTAVVLLSFLSGPVFAQSDTVVGKCYYKGGPERLDGRTINVADTMIALSELVRVMSTYIKDSSGSADTPSIFIIIDNSGSMGGTVSPTSATDRYGNRFVVTRKFIDTLNKTFPATEIGVAVFGSTLYFDPNDRAYFTRCAAQSQGAYIPLLRLDNPYAAYGNQTGYQILNTILDTTYYSSTSNHYTTTYNPAYQYVSLKYQPTSTNLRQAGTNINAGFDAARCAFAATARPHNSQFIIFLSDGDANVGNPATAFASATNIPTTFTVFFTRNGVVPASIATLTANAKINGYSEKNPNSNYWGYNNTSSDSLFKFLMANISNIIFTETVIQPSILTINNMTVTNYNSVDSTFSFQFMFPLTGTVTPINVVLTYHRRVNNVPLADTTFAFSYSVRRQPPAPPNPWAPPKDSFDVKTWTRNMRFCYADTPASPRNIAYIAETMDSVQVFFNFDSGNASYGYTDLRVELSNMNGARDLEILPLTRVSGNVFSVKFKRALIATANQGDGVVQYRGTADTIIAVFRNRENPSLPLDTLRRKIGFLGLNMQLTVTDTTIRAGDTTNRIRPRVTDLNGRTIDSNWVKSRLTYTQVPGTVQPGDQIVQLMGQYARFTGTRAWAPARQIVVTLTLPNGQQLTGTMQVNVIPAIPSHLVIEGSNQAQQLYPNADNPLGGPAQTITIGSAQVRDSGYAVLRDRFQNFNSYSTLTFWTSLQTAIIAASRGANTANGQGYFTKVGPMGTAQVFAVDSSAVPRGLRDTITVIVSDVTYDSLRIMRWDRTSSQYVLCISLTLTMPDSALLKVMAHRTDGLGGNNGWVDITGLGNWSATDLSTVHLPPQSQNTWMVVPQDITSTGRIYVSVPNVTRNASIPVTVLAGAPNVLYIYPNNGTPGPGNIVWPADPAVIDTITADDIFTQLYTKVFYNTGTHNIWLPQYDTGTLAAQIIWSVTPVADDTLSPLNTNHTTLKSRQANRLVRVTATRGALTYSVLLWVVHGAAHHLVIEASSASPNPIDDNPLAQISIAWNQMQGRGYAIVRDRWGNFVDYSRVTQWTSLAPTIFTAAGGQASVGEGIATRVASIGQGQMRARDTTYIGVTLQDLVLVDLQQTTYTALRIVLYNPYNTDVDTERIATDDSLTFYVEGQRSDNGIWEAVSANWYKAAALVTKSNPPAGISLSWTVTPNAANLVGGWIWARRSDAGSDSVWAIFTEGPPDSIALYRGIGDPSGVPRFPAIDTVAAGSTESIFAKIFDRNGRWLSRFETDSLSRTRITWTIQRLSGPTGGGSDPLSATVGNMTSFSPHIAYTLYQITATLNEGAVTRSASAMIYVTQSVAQHMVIEATANIIGPLLLGDHPLASIDFGETDTMKNAFAILRDAYGNFVPFPSGNSNLWFSMDQSLVTAREGASQMGEGVVTRIGPLGTTRVYAVNVLNPNLRDTVDVNVSSFRYDSLRITAQDPYTGRDTVVLYSLLIQHSGPGVDTLLHVQARRSYDGVWEDVTGNWNYTATSDTMSNPNAYTWNFAPIDTGHGVIVVTRPSGSTTLTASLPVVVLPGYPASLVLYPLSIPPGPTNQPLPGPAQITTIAAGATYQMVARIFDWRGVLLVEYIEPNSNQLRISWNATSRAYNDNLNARLSVTAGAIDVFSPTRAKDTVYIVSTLPPDPTHPVLLSDSVQIAIVPGSPAHLILERSTSYNDTLPNPVDTLRIADISQNGSVYAILRDPYNNFISFDTVITTWAHRNSSLINVAAGNRTIGEGIAYRVGLQGLDTMWAVDASGLKDSCLVQLLPYYYTALRIIVGNDTGPFISSTLVMNTNQDTMLRVQGRRSDNPALWEPVLANWRSWPNLTIDPTAPSNSQSWSFSPADTGTGWIVVTLLDAIPDSLRVRFTPGPPVRAVITIITPPDQRIAGQPILAEVRLYDLDNHLVRGPSIFNNSASYHDALIRGGNLRPEPFVLLGPTDTLWLDQSPWDIGSQTINSGIDTIPLTLFYAPFDTTSIDSLHQISVRLTTIDTTLTAVTGPFVLHPALLDSIALEEPDYGPVSDPLQLDVYGQTSVQINTRGYDRYGNRIGDIMTGWNVTETLHPLTPPNPWTFIIYSTSSVTENESGYIVAVHDSAGLRLADSIYVTIHGPYIRLAQAITADSSGNGFLDHLILRFNRRITLPSHYTFLNLRIQYGTVRFAVDSIQNNSVQRSDSIWVLALHEIVDTSNIMTVNHFQTDWQPTVYIPNQPAIDVEGTAGNGITAMDGAGPVIWKVVKNRVDCQDRSQDIVTVTFSEPVRLRNGANLSQNDVPASVFYIWQRDPNPINAGQFIRDSIVLTGIANLQSVPSGDSIATFVMSNNQVFGGNQHYVSIDTISSAANNYLADMRSNWSNSNNRRVAVMDTGCITGPVRPVPNPITPTFAYEEPGVFHIAQNNQALGWVNTTTGGRGGAALIFSLPNPPYPDVYVRCIIKIYDAVGNVVQAQKNDNFLSTFTDRESAGSVLNATIYWNGTNAKGMIAAPGVYRVVVYLEYWDSGSGRAGQYPVNRKVTQIGVGR